MEPSGVYGLRQRRGRTAKSAGRTADGGCKHRIERLHGLPLPRRWLVVMLVRAVTGRVAARCHDGRAVLPEYGPEYVPYARRSTNSAPNE
jgi:hypothetical protein